MVLMDVTQLCNCRYVRHRSLAPLSSKIGKQGVVIKEKVGQSGRVAKFI